MRGLRTRCFAANNQLQSYLPTESAACSYKLQFKLQFKTKLPQGSLLYTTSAIRRMSFALPSTASLDSPRCTSVLSCRDRSSQSTQGPCNRHAERQTPSTTCQSAKPKLDMQDFLICMRLHMPARSLHAVHKQRVQVEDFAGMCNASSLLQTTPCCTCAESVLSQCSVRPKEEAYRRQVLSSITPNRTLPNTCTAQIRYC